MTSIPSFLAATQLSRTVSCLKLRVKRVVSVESAAYQEHRTMASSSSVLRLYREMLRNAARFETYNFRSYALRRVKEDFRKNKSLQAGGPEQQKALAFARQQADVLYRQVVVSKLYPPHIKSVMETLPK